MKCEECGKEMTRNPLKTMDREQKEEYVCDSCGRTKEVYQESQKRYTVEIK